MNYTDKTVKATNTKRSCEVKQSRQVGISPRRLVNSPQKTQLNLSTLYTQLLLTKTLRILISFIRKVQVSCFKPVVLQRFKEISDE